jgi:hypothetical protein
MSFKIKTGLSPFNAALGRNISIPIQTPQIGKVFAVITTENTPTKELYEREGKSNGIGTIFYLDYIGSKDTVLNEVNLSSCSVAKPYYPHLQDYPLVGELVTLVDAPAPASQEALNITQKYYTGIINVWNNNQQNSLSNDSLGATFNENGVVLSKIPHQQEVKIDFSDCPDIAQTLSVIAAAKGIKLQLTGLESLRIKETDRIAAIQNELQKLGADMPEIETDLFEVVSSNFSVNGQLIDTYDDHRMAMAFAPLALIGNISIDNPSVVNKSYPSYWEHLKQIGIQIN